MAIEEREDVVRAKADLKDDLDVTLEATRHDAAVRVRDATAKENATRGVTFSFFIGMFPPLDDEPQASSPRVDVPAEAAQSTNRPLDGDVTEGSGGPPPGAGEERVDLGSE